MEWRVKVGVVFVVEAERKRRTEPWEVEATLLCVVLEIVCRRKGERG